MKKLLLCCVIVLTLMLTCVFATVAQATPDQQMNTESTEVTNQETTEATTEPPTEPATEPPTEPATEPPTQPSNIHGGTCGADARWELNTDTGVLTISGSGAMGGFNLPPWFWESDEVKKIVIQSGITVICDKAFSGCQYATSVSIPSTVTKIGKEAFASCGSLTDIKLPASVTELGTRAFYYCAELRNIELPKNITSLGAEVFGCCLALEVFTVPSGWKEITNSMFINCYNLVEITIPASVERVGSWVFRDCSKLGIVRFRGNAPAINQYAFEGVKTSVSYPAGDSTWTVDKLQNYGGELTWFPEGGSGVQASGSFGTSDIMNWKIEGEILYITGNGYMSGWSAKENAPWYGYRSHIKKVVMSGNMQNIYSRAFRGCTRLTEVVWPSGITIIFECAFADCSSLEKIVIPDSVQKIGGSAFSGCAGLASVTLPKSLTEIGGYAFEGCKNLKSITIPSGVGSVMDRVFLNCTALRTIYFTGKMPRFSEKGIGYGGTFGGISNVTVYYPASNSSWTAAKVQALNTHYESSYVIFVLDKGVPPVQSTEAESTDQTPDSTQPPVNADPGAITTEPEETKTDTTIQAEPEATTDAAAQETVKESEAPSDTAIPEETAEPATDTHGENAESSKRWVVAVAGVTAVAIIATGAFIWKKKKLSK